MARLTEQQITALRPLVVEYPEHAKSRVVYPAARRRRTPAAGLDDGIASDAPAALPPNPLGSGTARIFPFYIRNVGGETVVAVTPSIQGPAYIPDGFWQLNLASTATVPTITILASTDNDGAGSGFAITVAITGNPIFERAITATAEALNFFNRDGVPVGVSFGGGNHNPIPIGKKIDLSNFYLKLVLRGTFGASSTWLGWLRVIEGIGPNFNPTPV
jgi:hypothetical protein